MKATLTIILIAFCVSVAGQIREPLRHYSFDDAGAATGLEDSSGNGATLKMYGNPTFSTTLKASGSSAISLDGTGDMLTIPTTNLTNEFFVSFWARTNADITAYRYFLSKAGSNAWDFRAAPTNKIYAHSYITGDDNTTAIAVWTKETWHHIVVYYNDGGSSTKVRIYLDGSKLTLADSLIATGIDVNDSIYIGANLNRGGLWIGQIDELRIYSGFAPSQVQVDSLYQKTYIGTPGSGSGYNPIIGRHMRFYANGVERKDKGRDGTFQYWLAKKQAVATYTQIDLAQDRTYILSGDAQDYDWVGELQASRSWRVHEGGTIFYTYNINEDTSELFGISSNVIYCKDISAMQSSKTYAITYSVYDGYFYDVAQMYIYKPPADSCVTVTNWTGYDNNFQAGYYYFQPRGSSSTVIAQLDINVNDVHFGAIGTGNLPILNKGWPSATTDGIFYASNKTGITFQSMQFDPNGYGGSVYAAAIYTSIATNVRINNCSFVGDVVGNDLWAYPARLEKTVSLLFSNNAVSGAVFDGLYVTGCEVGNIINNRVANVNSNTIHNNGDIFNLRTPPNTAGSFTIRHNYGNKSTFSGKSIVSLLKPGTASPSGNDTLEMNYFVGYAQTGEVATSEGTTLFNFAGVDNAVIRYNVAEDCSRGLYTTSYNVSIDGTSYTCAGNENNKMYYNLFKNIYILPVQLNNLSNGTQIYNNTFAGYGTSWYTGFTAVKGAIATGGFDVDVINNVFAQSGVEPYYGSEGTGTIDYNIYSDAGSHTLGAQELEANPLLNSDYTLHIGSPAINEGTTTISSGLGFDLKRITVPQDALYDLGCYEGAYNGELLGSTGGEIDLTNFNIYLNKTFEDYNESVFPGNYFGTTYREYNTYLMDVVNDPYDVTNKVLRIRSGGPEIYPPTISSFGCEIKAEIPGADLYEVYLTFDWWYSENFQSTRGGKFGGGVGGLPWTPSGTAWLARTSFQQANKVNSYSFDRLGGANPYTVGGNPAAYLNNGNKHSITQRVVINSTTGTSNGIIETWVDNKRVIGITNRRFWDGTNTRPIDYVSIEHFYGGGGDCGDGSGSYTSLLCPYYPTVTTYGYIDNIRVWTPKTPVVTGNTLHPTSTLPYSPNSITDKTFKYDTFRNTTGTLQNSEYGSPYGILKDETWLIDAGAGNTVKFDYTYSLSDVTGGSSAWGWGDFLMFYDGNTTDSDLIEVETWSSGSGTVTSTGRYMFVRFVTDKETGTLYPATGFTGTLTFN